MCADKACLVTLEYDREYTIFYTTTTYILLVKYYMCDTIPDAKLRHWHEYHLHLCDSLGQFKQLLKTHLFGAWDHGAL